MYSNLDAAPHPADLGAIAARLGDHLAGPVRFAEMIEAMYRDGARVFVEVGPGSILTPLIDAILKDRPHLAVAAIPRVVGPGRLAPRDRPPGRGRAAASARITDPRPVDARCSICKHLPAGETLEPTSPSTWLVNGSRARPVAEPEPTRLGQAIPDSSRPADRQRHSVSQNGTHATKPRQQWYSAVLQDGPGVSRLHDATSTRTEPDRQNPRSLSERNGNLEPATSHENSLVTAGLD